MNQLKCPGCGAIICDFVIYCPECGFALKDYFDQQTAARTAGFFADVVPAATETASASVSAEKKETKSRPHKVVGIVLLMLSIVFLVLAIVLPMNTFFNKTEQELAFPAPTVSEGKYYSEVGYDYTLTSTASAPYAAVYQGVLEPLVCVYMENGTGVYTGEPLGEALGYLDVDESVHMKSISTTYQYYVLENGEKLCLVNFDITFNQEVNGLFLYDLSYNNGIHYQGRSVAVMNGKTRIAEYVSVLPSTLALEAHLMPKGFVNTGQTTLQTGERIWGGDVDFNESSPLSGRDSDSWYANGDKICSIPVGDTDLYRTLILYRYTVESGGNEFELGRSVYHVISAADNETDAASNGTIERMLTHRQLFYGYPVSKPTYTRDVIGVLPLHSYQKTASA